MKPTKFSLRALWQKLVRKQSQPALSRRAAPAPKREMRSIEPLEGRIAPATLIDASTISFTDLDGDTVEVHFSKNLFTPTGQATLAAVFKFADATGADSEFGNSGRQQLQMIDLTKVPLVNFVNPAAGVSLTVTSTPVGDLGTGQTTVGAIKAAGLALGAVTIDGDLGQIDAGSAAVKVAVQSLTVQSFGKNGLTTQLPSVVGSAGDADRAEKLESRITGELRTLTVHDDMEGYLHLVHGRQFVNGQTLLTTLGKIGSVTIGGSLLGKTAVGTASDNTGLIDAEGDIGRVKIGTNADDGIFGGGGRNSGRLTTGGVLGSLTVSGSIEGFDGANSGTVHAVRSLAQVTIGGDLAGGKGTASGVLSSDDAIGRVRIAGDILGVIATAVPNVTEDAGARSGGITADGKISDVRVGGDIVGGGLTLTGFIESQREIGFVTVLGDVTGGTGTGSGSITSGGKIGIVTIAGKLDGGDGANSGSLLSGLDLNLPGTIGVVKVAAIEGGAGNSSGSIISGGRLASLTIGAVGGSGLVVKGGAGDFSGAIYSHGDLGTVRIFGNVEGAAGDHSGSVESNGAFGALSITGSLKGGTGDFSGSVFAHDDLQPGAERLGNVGTISVALSVTGGDGASSGAVLVDGRLNAAVLGSLQGGAGAGSGELLIGLGGFGAGTAGKIRITGGVSDSAIRAADSIGSVTIGGSLEDSTISARGQFVQGRRADVAIGAVSIVGAVSGSQILAGYDLSGEAVNADAQIGLINVRGAWTASSAVAGAVDTDGDGFGDADDALISGAHNARITARIASIIIGGAITGSDAANDHFGFVAEQIGAFKNLGARVPLSPTGIDVREFDLPRGDTSLRELARLV